MRADTGRLHSVGAPTRTARIGAVKGVSLKTCSDALEAPFEERLAAFLDLLYSDETRAGVRSEGHAQSLFRIWLELSVAHDPGGGFLPYLKALIPFYPAHVTDRSRADLSREAAEKAMRAPFDELLLAYIDRLFDPAHDSGIRDAGHAIDTFVTFCHLLKAYQERQ